MPPDDPEPSELEEALFGSTELDPTPVREARPHEPPADLSKLDAALFGESGQGAGGDAAAVPPDAPRQSGPARRFGLGMVVVLLVLSLGGLAFAAFGTDDDSTPKKAKVEVRRSEAVRTTLQTTTTSSTTTTSTTTSTTTTTTAPPPAPVVVPDTEPPIAEPPPTEPPPTPPTEPTTTTMATAPPT